MLGVVLGGSVVGSDEESPVGRSVGVAEGKMLGVLVGGSMVGTVTGENVGLWEGEAFK